MKVGEGKKRGETERERVMYTNKSSGIWNRTVGQRECSLFLFPLIFHCMFFFFFHTAATIR